MEKVGIFFGSTSGNTQSAAKKIAAGFDNATCIDVNKASSEEVSSFTNLIMGASTWGFGDLQDDFEEFKSQLSSCDLSGKQVAIFGLGDQDGYPDTFVDGMADVLDTVKDAGANIIGFTSIDGYGFDASRAVVNDKFVGLVLDEDNQSDMTDARIEQWVTQLKGEFKA